MSNNYDCIQNELADMDFGDAKPISRCVWIAKYELRFFIDSG